MTGVPTIYVAVLFLGMLGSRIKLIGARGGIEHDSLVLALIDLIGNCATLSLIVWGSAALAWYWPVTTLLSGGIALAFIVTRTNWSLWFAVYPILDLIAAAGGLYLWIRHWPF